MTFLLMQRYPVVTVRLAQSYLYLSRDARFPCFSCRAVVGDLNRAVTASRCVLGSESVSLFAEVLRNA